jgi:hypothetical protein
MSTILENVPRSKWKYIFETFVINHIKQNFDIQPIIGGEEFNMSEEIVEKFKLKKKTSVCVRLAGKIILCSIIYFLFIYLFIWKTELEQNYSIDTSKKMMEVELI